MVNWKEYGNPFLDFTEEITQEWIDRGFDKEECKEWLGADLKLDDFCLCSWLRDDKGKDAEWVSNYGNNQKLRNQYKIFTQTFISELMKDWIDRGFSREEFEKWTEKAEIHPTEAKFAQWLKNKKIDPSFINYRNYSKKGNFLGDLEIFLRERYKKSNAQGWWYLKNLHEEEKEKITKLDIENQDIEGNLDLSDFRNLSVLFCSNNKITSLNLSNCSELLFLRCSNNLLTGLDLSNNQKLVKIELRNNKITTLDLSNNNELVSISCEDNFLTKLFLNNCPNMVNIVCRSNKLRELNINNLNKLKAVLCQSNQLRTLNISDQAKSQLELLQISNNHFPPQDLSFFSDCVSLRVLSLGNSAAFSKEKKDYNHFYGSLKHLKKMTKLENLDIANTDIDNGLKYLSGNVKKIEYHTDIRPNARCQMLEKELEKYKKSSDHLDLAEENKKGIELVLNIPPGFSSSLHSDAKEYEKHRNQGFYFSKSHIKEKITYNKIYTLNPSINEYSSEHHYELLEAVDEDKQKPFKKLLTKQLPTKLFYIDPTKSGEELLVDVKENVKRKEDCKVASSYLILSYVWGEKKEGEILSLGGKKSLLKAIETCRYLNDSQGVDTNYLWMDQLCINQDDTKEGKGERNEEVLKMRKYYSNATGTLIAINQSINEHENQTFSPLCYKGTNSLISNVMDLIIDSQWFSRSWTFQEGLLGKQTIFMFDDCLVDGRVLAWYWAYRQPFKATSIGFTKQEEDEWEELKEKCKFSVKIATPLGWTYCENGYEPKEKVTLTLNQALRAVKNRERTLSIDGIYSILGLLPYGEKAKPKYKEWGHEYAREELEEALLEIMKLAVENGYAEPLTWHGEKSGWLPKIYEKDEKDSESNIVLKFKGSTNIVGEIETIDIPKKIINFEVGKGNIKIIGSEYSIFSCDNSMSSELSEWYLDFIGNSIGIRYLIKNFEVDSGLYKKKIILKVNDKLIPTIIWGIRETLEEAKVGNSLVVFDKKVWNSKRSFALLILKDKNSDIYHCLGLVEFFKESEAEKLEGSEKKEIIISIDNERKNQVQNWVNLPVEITNIDKESFYDALESQEESKDLFHDAQKYYSKSMKIDYATSWKGISSSLTPKIIQKWQNFGFTSHQTQDWINTGLHPADANFASWLRDELKLTPIEFLNDSSIMEDLREQFSEYQTQIEQPPKF